MWKQTYSLKIYRIDKPHLKKESKRNGAAAGQEMGRWIEIILYKKTDLWKNVFDLFIAKKAFWKWTQ